VDFLATVDDAGVQRAVLVVNDDVVVVFVASFLSNGRGEIAVSTLGGGFA
jgi:hypothetical protein